MSRFKWVAGWWLVVRWVGGTVGAFIQGVLMLPKSGFLTDMR